MRPATANTAGTVEAVSVLLRPRWLALHAFTVLVVAGCAGAAYWQFLVAKDGSGRSLGYALQWPAIGLFGLGVWAWLCRDGVRAVRDGRADPDSGTGSGPGDDHVEERVPVRTTVVPEVDPAEDPELAAYNAMLAKLHEKDGR